MIATKEEEYSSRYINYGISEEWGLYVWLKFYSFKKIQDKFNILSIF